MLKNIEVRSNAKKKNFKEAATLKPRLRVIIVLVTYQTTPPLIKTKT